MTGYTQLIIDAGVPQVDADAVEEIMRQDIFHSTLDWQTRKQLQDAARQAMELLTLLRAEGLAR